MTLVLEALPDCVVCRRQVCADASTCKGELARLLERTRDRFEDEHFGGLREVRLREVSR